MLYSSLIAVHFFLSGNIPNIDGTWKLHNCNRIHSRGANGRCYNSCHLVCCVSNNLLYHFDGQREHHHVNKRQSPASHPHVPFPQPFGFCRHWVLLISHTHHAEGISHEGNIYTCGWLCGSTLLCGDIWVS